MKKNIAIAFVLCVLLTLFAGCGNNSSESPENETQNNEQESETLSYERGILTETGYESQYLDIKFTVPEGFVMATEEDILGMMQVGVEIMDLDKDTIDYSSLTTVYEMMVSSASGSPNVALLTEKLMSNVTVEQYLDIVKSQLADVPMNYEFGDVTSVEIAGESYQQIVASAEIKGTAFLQKYIVRKFDDRMVCFVVTNTSETEKELDTLMKAFTKY